MKSGFTLIELLIVLAIIGALMSIGIPIYTNALQNAKAVVIAANMRIILDTVRTDLLMNQSPSANGTGTEYEVSDYVELDDVADYKLEIIDNTDKWNVKVTYSGKSVNPDLVLKKLTGCATESKDDQNRVICELDVEKIF